MFIPASDSALQCCKVNMFSPEPEVRFLKPTKTEELEAYGRVEIEAGGQIWE